MALETSTLLYQSLKTAAWHITESLCDEMPYSLHGIHARAQLQIKMFRLSAQDQDGFGLRFRLIAVLNATAEPLLRATLELHHDSHVTSRSSAAEKFGSEWQATPSAFGRGAQGLTTGYRPCGL